MLNYSIRHRLLRPPSPHGLVFFLLPLTKSLSSSFIVSNSESAISASQKLHFKSAENPNAVLRLLRDYGFGATPLHFSSDPHSTLMPKLEFFRGFGFSGESLVRLLTSQPLLLKRSLANHIIPCFTFLRTLLPAEGDIVCFFSRSPHSLNTSLNTSILPILSVLREHDLPEARISKLLKIQLGILMLTPLRVNGIVEEVKAAGVPTSNPIFVYAFRTVARLKRANWDRKMAVFESFGLSEADIVSSFRRHPVIMKMSAEKIRRSLEFFLGRLKLVPEDVGRHPILLKFSLEKRILPRCAVVSVLKRKGKLEENSSAIPALLATTSLFSKRYAMRYQDDVPEALKAYNGEIEFKG